MRCECFQGVSRVGIPQQHAAVLTSTCQGFPIGAERHAIDPDPIRMHCEYFRGFTCSDIP